MCGRFTLINAARAYEAYLRRKAGVLLEPRYNIAPGQKIGVVLRGEGGERVLEEFLWGFTPKWTPPGERGPSIVNARSETVATKPAFREAFRRRRCLVPADGFYEWRREPGRRQPYFFRLRGERPFAFAALWEEWRPDAGREGIRTCCLLTTNANAMLEKIHHRMPVILDEEAARHWLDAPADAAPSELGEWLRPFPSEEMESRAANPWVNKAGHEGPRCLEPPPEEQTEQLPLL